MKLKIMKTLLFCSVSVRLKCSPGERMTIPAGECVECDDGFYQPSASQVSILRFHGYCHYNNAK